MTVSGHIDARCKVCGCVFNWHLDSFPFVDSEIVGTCKDCFERKDHDVYNENFVESFETLIPAVKKRIVFDRKGKGHHFKESEKK